MAALAAWEYRYLNFFLQSLWVLASVPHQYLLWPNVGLIMLDDSGSASSFYPLSWLSFGWMTSLYMEKQRYLRISWTSVRWNSLVLSLRSSLPSHWSSLVRVLLPPLERLDVISCSLLFLVMSSMLWCGSWLLHPRRNVLESIINVHVDCVMQQLLEGLGEKDWDIDVDLVKIDRRWRQQKTSWRWINLTKNKCNPFNLGFSYKIDRFYPSIVFSVALSLLIYIIW